MRRLPILMALVAVVAALGAPPAAQAGLVRSFGHGGIAPLAPPLPPGVEGLGEALSQPAPDGSTYLSATAQDCYKKKCFRYLFRFRSNGRPDTSFGGRGFVTLDAPGGGTYSLSVDDRSRPILARSLGTDKVEGTQVFRYTKGGRLDRAFDGDGRAFLPKLTGYGLELQAVPGGGILFSNEDSEGNRDSTTVRLDELHANGSPVRSFGGDGFVLVNAPGRFPLPPIPTPRGAIFIAGFGCCGDVVSVIRVTARGRGDRRFDRNARESLKQLAKLEGDSLETELQANDAVARRGGGVELFGEFGRHGFAVWLTRDGDAAPGFGKRGIHLYEEPLNAALTLRGGGLLAFSQGWYGPLRPYLLEPDGTQDRRFRPIALAPYTSLVAPIPIGPGTVDVTFGRRHEEPYSEPPFVARLRLPSGKVFR